MLDVLKPLHSLNSACNLWHVMDIKHTVNDGTRRTSLHKLATKRISQLPYVR